MVECTSDKIINPTTKRCVLKTGKIGIEILKIQKSKKSQKKIDCGNDKIMNPTTQRCVSKTGKIGLEILKTQKSRKSQGQMGECSDDKIMNPKTGRCVSKNGKIGLEILGEQSKGKSLKKKIENAIIKSEWFIITKNGCAYCAKAKSILTQNNKKFSELETTDSNIIYNVTDRYTSGYHFFPMIFNNGKFIGGFQELDNLKLNSIPSTPYIKSPLHEIKIKPYNETTFGGLPSDAFSAMLYLQYKYPDDCIAMSEIIPTGHWYDFALGWNEKSNNFFIPFAFWKSIQKCLNSGATFIVMPFIFMCHPPPYHANYLVYNSKTREMERFEPNGFISLACVNPPDLDSKIKNLFNKNIKNQNIGKDMITKMYSPLDFCPYLGFQRIQGDEFTQHKSTDPAGFCLAWATWYADVRLANPNKSRKQVVQMALDQMKKNPDSFTIFIRSYAEFTLQIQKKIKDSKDPKKFDKILIEMMQKTPI